MAETRQDVLLSRINDQIKKGAMTISDLSKELQQDIKDTTGPEIVSQGLKATHSFLLQLMPLRHRKYFEWPE